MSIYKEKIAFRKIRNFSETIGVASYFIKQNIGILLKAAAFIALPIVMIGFLGVGITSLGFIENATKSNIDGLVGGLGMFYMAMFVMWLGLVLVMGCIYEYVVLYEQSEDFQAIKVGDISRNVFGHIGLYIGTTILLTVTLSVLFFFVFLFLGVFIFIHEVFIFFGTIGMIFVLSYIIIALSNIYLIRIVEKRSFFDAFGRCFNLLEGHFGSTLGLYFITSLISFSLLGLLPMIIQGVSLFFAETLMFETPILFYALQIFYSLFYVGYNIIYSVVISFRYFSLVEAKEGIGMLQKIEQIGQHLSVENELDR
ncbi:MAG: hypothetical protein ACPG5B_12660 [Chitinophagales bacterium]